MIQTKPTNKTNRLLFFFVLLSLACSSNNKDFSPKQVQVHTTSGMYTFEVEIADDADEREQGLMNRTDLTDNQGMLFVFPVDVYTSFWMKDTPLSLDIIFLNANKEVVMVAASTTPGSTDLISPDVPVRYVFEVKAGFAERSGLKTGNVISF